MTTYEKRPETVDAAMWDGTLEGAEKINDLMQRHVRFRTPLFVLHVEWMGNDVNGNAVEPEAWLEINTGGDRRSRMTKGMWLVCSRTHGFEVMHEDEFTLLYDVPMNVPAND